MHHKLDLNRVQKPGRYTGGEYGSIVKDKTRVALRYAFCFPDTYEIGMSHLGMKILYAHANAREDCWCERVFAPWVDMEQEMRANGVPLYGLESGDPLRDFDLLGFTLQYELSYTNILNMLDLAGLPLRARERTSLTPLVIAGGSCACNAEPLSDFIDVFVLGEGEEISGELLDLLKQHKQQGSDKQRFLRAAAQLPGIYVPSLYTVDYHADGTIAAVTAQEDAPFPVQKRIVRDLDGMFAPDAFVVPFLETVHDRTTVELFRGCARGCRFCQAGFLYRPIREKSAQTVEAQCKNICEASGYDEISLCSLSTSDYSDLEPLLRALLRWTPEEKINIALPSLRMDNFPQELMEQLTEVRRSGLTFAPEAGTQRLRDVINKNITQEEILSTARQAFEGGWTAVKLYFMLGLPTETEEDITGIAQLAQQVVDAYYQNPNKPKGKSVSVSLGASSFVPKPFTPFQWEAQDTPEVLEEKQKLLRSSLTTRKVTVGRHKAQLSMLEGVFARGDRRLGAVLERAFEKGCKFDGWDDQFRFDSWMEAFRECAIDPAFYANRKREFSEILPWDHLDYGISKAFLMRENEKAHKAATTACCLTHCAACGADRLDGGCPVQRRLREGTAT